MADKEKLLIHPRYLEELEDVQRITAFLDGRRKTVVNGKYVVKHVTETIGDDGAKAFSLRLQRTYNKNITRPYADIHLAHLSQPIQVGEVDDRLKEIENDVTAKGESLKDFSRDVLWYRISHGRVAVLTDMPPVVPASKGEAVTDKVRSYSNVYPSESVLYWEYFETGPRKGQLRRLVLRESDEVLAGNTFARVVDISIDESASAKFQVRRLRAEIDEKNKGRAIDDIEFEQSEPVVVGGLSIMPATLWGEGVEDSLLMMCAEYNHSHLNVSSVRTEINTASGFRTSFVLSDSIDAAALKLVGPARVIAVKGTVLEVQTLDPVDPVAVEKEMIGLEVAAFKSGLMLNSQLLDDTRQVQSYESKAFDAKAREAEYNRLLDGLENLISRMLRFHAEFEGIDGTDDLTVTVGREFGLDDPEKTALERAQLNSIARELGVIDVQKAIAKSLVVEGAFRVVPGEGETKETTVKKLLEAIEEAAAPVEDTSLSGGLFGSRLNSLTGAE